PRMIPLFRPAPLLLRAAALVLGLSLVAGPAREACAAEPDYETLLAERAPAIVTVKFVTKSSDWESSNDVLGTIVEPTGPGVTGARPWGGGTESRGASLKVLIGCDATENETILVARDGVLGLAYLQILSPPGGKPLPFIDLAKGVDPKVGQSLFGVSRHRAE